MPTKKQLRKNREVEFHYFKTKNFMDKQLLEQDNKPTDKGEWEHDFDDIHGGIVERSRLMKKRSENGWELVSVVYVPHSNDKLQFYWKRKTESSLTPK